MKDKTKHRLRTRSYFPRLYKLRIALSILYFRIGNLSSFSGLTIDITEIRGVFDGASGAAAAALFVGAQNPLGHK